MDLLQSMSKIPKHFSQALLDETKRNLELIDNDQEWVAKQLLYDEIQSEDRVQRFVKRGYRPVRKI